MKDDKPIYKPQSQQGDEVICPQCGNTLDKMHYKAEESVVRCRDCGHLFTLLYDEEIGETDAQPAQKSRAGNAPYLMAAVLLLSALLLAYLISILKN